MKFGLLRSTRRNEPAILGPFIGDSPFNGVTVDTTEFNRLSKGHLAPIEYYDAIAASIVGLFFVGSPPAIFSAISGLIVDAFKGMARRWPWPHVFKEQLEVFPAFADRNPAASIIIKIFNIRIQAALRHRRPHMKLRTVTESVRQMLVSSITPTRDYSTAAKRRPGNNAASSADAKTQEVLIARRRRPGAFDDRQPAKPFTNLDGVVRFLAITSISHAVHSLIVKVWSGPIGSWKLPSGRLYFSI